MRLLLSCLALAALTLVSCHTPAADAEAPGRVDCEVFENDKAASGSFRALAGTREAAKGVCGKGSDVAPGSYELEVTLDGAVDRPTKHENVTASSGQTARAIARFETGELVIDVKRGGQRTLAIVKLLRDKQQVASLTAGVASRVSVGTYSVEVDARGNTHSFGVVSVVRADRRELSVDFLPRPSP